ncbi:short-chain dehydrogenase/reductase SDR [Mycobacterium xenopi RIVM700367]|nr:short-chain dehydrogenase/reductase SDR [Mycobacterium xenopi RIVM700367]
MVTGASSGIGEQFARQLVARGYRVVITARREDRLQKLCTELGGDEHAVAVGTDLAVPQDRDRLAARIDELGAHVDILVNNAGLGIYTKFGAAGRDKELQMLRVDVEAVVDLMLRYLPGMVDRGRGTIINMSSVSGFQPAPYNAGYAAAKAYVLWLSEAVHAEVAASGVTVTAVCPGPVPTEFQTVNDADFLVSRLPAFARVPAERVVADALKAAERGRATVVPGGPHVRSFLASSRFIPTPLALPVVTRMYKR